MSSHINSSNSVCGGVGADYDVSKVESLNVTVVSKKVGPEDVVKAIDKFLSTFKARLESMPASEITSHKKR